MRHPRILLFIGLSVLAGLAYFLLYDPDHTYLIPPVEYQEKSSLTESLHPRPCSWDAPFTASGYPDSTGRIVFPYCPPNFAIFGNDDTGGMADGPGRYIGVHARCCPLPSDDILTEEHVYGVEDSCPDDFIMTGGTVNNCGANCMARCTRINTDKYRLAPKQQAFYWKDEKKNPSSGRGSAKQTRYHQLPLGIRHGLGFQQNPAQTPDGDGCVGIPFGSLLVEKKAVNCSGYYYRQLLFRSTGNPVPMFPDCIRIAGKGECIAPPSVNSDNKTDN